jgi:hypothetical protein
MDTENDRNSPMLNTTACKSIDILYWKDVTGGSGTAATSVQTCMAATDASGNTPDGGGFLDDGVCWTRPNTVFNGEPDTSTEAEYKLKTLYIYANTASVTGGGKARLLVRCND